MRFPQKILFIILCLLSFQFVAANEDSTQDNGLKDFESRSGSLKSLMQAYRIMATDAGTTDQAHQFEQKILDDIGRAKNHYQKNNQTTGRSILDQSYAQVKNAIVQLRDGQTMFKSLNVDEQYEVKNSSPRHAGKKEKLDHSLDSLLNAYQRVAKEKGIMDQAAVLQSNISHIRTDAEQQYAAADDSAGDYLLNGAYILVREALAALREGETLTESLNFANNEEEFQYYVRKTESQKTAIAFLLNINDSPSKSRILSNLLNTSQQWIDQAHNLATQNRYDAANPIMDKAFTRLQSGLMMSLSSP